MPSAKAKKTTVREQVTHLEIGYGITLERGEGEEHLLAKVDLVRDLPSSAFVEIREIVQAGCCAEYEVRERIFAEYTELRVEPN